MTAGRYSPSDMDDGLLAWNAHRAGTLHGPARALARQRLPRSRLSSVAIHITYARARANLAELCDRVTSNREVVIIERRNVAPVAMIDASELVSLCETAHLLRSPRNARRLLAALERARGEALEP